MIPYSQGVTLQRSITTVGVVTNIYLVGSLPIILPSMNVIFGSSSYPVSGSNFNISLGSLTNSLSASDTSLYSVMMESSSLVGFSSNMAITPSLTPKVMSSFVNLLIPSAMTISQNTNIILSIAASSISSVSLQVPPFFVKLVQCCIEPKCSQTNIVNCTFSSLPNSNLLIEANFVANQTVSSFTAQVLTLPYQAIFPSSLITAMTGLPSSSISFTQDVAVYGNKMPSNLTVSSFKVNDLATYSLFLSPINSAGIVRITLPSFLTDQIKNAPITAIINGNAINMSLSVGETLNSNNTIIIPLSLNSSGIVTQKNISFSWTKIINPTNNKPYMVTI